MAGNVKSAQFVVVGGGIAGVTCAEHLSLFAPSSSVILITASPLVKAVTNFRKVSKVMEDFDIEERPWQTLQVKCPNVEVIHDAVKQVDYDSSTVITAAGLNVSYEKLCLCSGARPKLIETENPRVIGIRDTESVESFAKKLVDCQRVVIVGNGGIATELVYELRTVHVVWCIKDESITSAFVDPGAAQFFLKVLGQEGTGQEGKEKSHRPLQRHTFGFEAGEGSSGASRSAGVHGSALGPDWARGRHLVGSGTGAKQVSVEYKVEVKQVLTPDQFKACGKPEECGKEDGETWPVYVELTNGKVLGCDVIVSATGVVPNTELFTRTSRQMSLAYDGGIAVNDRMETGEPNVYAAGDVCSATWEAAPRWHQMRLWSQARQMGAYAARCMVAAGSGEPVELDFCFELFAHVTRFFGYKIVLLGSYNGQGVGADQEMLLRVTDGVEFVKVILSKGRMVGALLIGDTDLEETFENVILNELDLTAIKDDLLDPNIDIDDFFD